MFSFEGKKALVTGGGRGIGRAIALAFARQGADVALAARSRSELESVAVEIRSIGRKAVVYALDLANTDRAVNMVNTAAGELGSLDILVNNAGGITDVPGSVGPLAETTLEAFDAMYALNVRTPLFAAVAACRVMSSQGNGGAILGWGPKISGQIALRSIRSTGSGCPTTSRAQRCICAPTRPAGSRATSFT